MASLDSTTLVVILLLLYILFGYGIVELQAYRHAFRKSATISESLTNQPYRTGFHFQPLKNYMNDPNGPMLYKGRYHLFYQYNPIGDGSPDGPRVWGHSTSTDLVNWTPQPIAIQAQMSSNSHSSFSGSATILPGNKPVILFTGINSQDQQVQNVAVPKNLSDPYLREWVLVPQNPVMYPTVENKIDPKSFRDPSTAWLLPDGKWRVIIGSKRNNSGLALLFRSKDFIHWVLAEEPLYSEKDTGMWECVDFFPVYVKGRLNKIGADTSTFGPNVKHVLKASLSNNQDDVYTIGTYDIKKDIYSPDIGFKLNASSLRYDYGLYYASKTFYDGAKKRRILLSWILESSNLTNDEIKIQGWSGIHGIPRSIWLDQTGKQLIQWPVSEVETLRKDPVSLSTKVIKGGSLFEVTGITASQADVEMSFNISSLKNAEKFQPYWTDPQSLCSQYGASLKGGLGPFGLLTLASKDLEEYTAVFFKIFKATDKVVVLMCSDQSRSSLNPIPYKTTYGTFVDANPIRDGLSLRILIDHSVIETFGGEGKNAITARVYPTLAIDGKAHLYAFNNGTGSVKITGFTAWSMKKAQIA